MTATDPHAIFSDFLGKTLTRRLLACLLFMVSPSLFAATQQELTGVKSEISRQQQSLAEQQKSLDQLQQALKQQELGINSIENQITKTKNDLENANRNIAQLNSNIQALETQKQQQADKLERLLQTYYLTKRSLTNGQFFHRSADEDRISQYYQHLAKSRAQAIEALEKPKPISMPVNSRDKLSVSRLRNYWQSRPNSETNWQKRKVSVSKP